MTPADWADHTEPGGTFHLTPEHLAYIGDARSQIAAASAMADVQPMIDSLPELPIVAFAFVVVLQEGEAEGVTKSMLYGPRLALSEVLDKLSRAALGVPS